MSDITITSEKKTINQIQNQNTLIINTQHSEISNNLIVNNNSNFNKLSINSNLTINGNSNIKINNYDVYNPFVPSGTILSFATKKAPDGWLSCDGSYILIANYQNLYELIGNIWDKSSDNDNTRFRLPDLNISGCFIRGGNVDGIINEHTTKKPINDFDMSLNGTTSSNGNHNHGLYHTHGGTGIERLYPSRYQDYSNSTTHSLNGIDSNGNHQHSLPTTIINSSSIGNWDNETIPIHVKLLYCIKY